MLAILVAGAGGHSQHGGSDQVSADVAAAAQGKDYSLKPCDEGFAQFHSGSSFQGHALSDHSRICTAPQEPERSLASGGGIDPDSLGRSNFDSYVYGTCTPEPDQGCAPPLEIQTWPACERSPADYNAGMPGDAHQIQPRETLQLRGVAARLYDDGSLELNTKAVTVVIWGNTREQLVAAANALRTEAGAPFQRGPRQPLPEPVAGSQDGTLSC